LFSRFFIDRPIFASVLSIVITLAGAIALKALPLALYPPVSPPNVSVSCSFPGADARAVSESVASPIEEQVNGVENMLYMSSSCTNDGAYSLTITFEHGVDLNLAQIRVQNRVSLALPKLPDVIKQTGVLTRKRAPDILMSVALISPDNSYDQLYLSNYALMHVKEEISRVPGVGDISMFGQKDYSMRIWVDPEKLAARSMTAGDVVAAIREQNMPVATGQIGQPPIGSGQAIQVTLSTHGRLVEPEEFADIIVKRTPDGRLTRIRDIGRVVLGAKNEDQTCQVNHAPAASMGIFQLPDANALETADRVRAKMAELAKDLPPGIRFQVRYDTTPYIRQTIDEVFKTLQEAVILVAIVVLLFLQNWRSAVIPLVAVPVAIIGTFGVMAAMGFSLNNLTLFGLVLAIGIVVDDAIVVVEAVEHHIERGLSPRDATLRAMDEVSGPVIAIGLVLSAVFVPCAFISGITGQFFRQFALTIASSTLISAFNSLTLSPALAALLLRPREHQVRDVLPRVAFLALGGWIGYVWLTPWLESTVVPQGIARFSSAAGATAPWWISPALAAAAGAVAGWLASRPLNWFLGGFFRVFNAGFNRATNVYTRLVGMALRVSVLVVLVYVGMIFLTYRAFASTPKGFIPSADMGYLMVNMQLPDSASAERTITAMDRLETISHETLGVAHTQAMSGNSLVMNASGSNFASLFVVLDEFALRPVWLSNRIFRLLELNPRQAKVRSWLGWSGAKKPDLEERVRKWLGLEKDPKAPSLYSEEIANRLRSRFTEEAPEADIKVYPPPPVRGVGRAGGFNMVIEDRGDLGVDELQKQTDKLVARANKVLRLPDESIYVPGERSIYSPKLGYHPFAPATATAEISGGKIRAITIDNPGVGYTVPPVVTISAPDSGTGVQATATAVIAGGEVTDIVVREKERGAGYTSVPKVVIDVGGRLAMVGCFTAFRANVPQFYADVNRTESMAKEVDLQDLFETLRVYLGSLYVNDFNRFGRTWQVIVQGEASYRRNVADIKLLKVRNIHGTMIPVGALADFREKPGPLILTRYNMYPSASINGNAALGISSGTAIDIMGHLASDPDEGLPPSMAYEWTELAFFEKQAGNTAMYIFGFAVVMVFLVLAAQYESWSLPLAVIMVVPMCLLSAIEGVKVAKEDINIFTQIGFVVLVGLASKNAILIVEFAKYHRDAGESRRQSTLEACRLRLRPIVMTSLAFILGVLPLLLGQGAGAEMRRTLGITVFSGMLGVTLFGIFLTPVFFFVIDWMSEARVWNSPLVRWTNTLVLGTLSLRPLRQFARTLKQPVTPEPLAELVPEFEPEAELEPEPAQPK
jgi:multidrug efflux pump